MDIQNFMRCLRWHFYVVSGSRGVSILAFRVFTSVTEECKRRARAITDAWRHFISAITDTTSCVRMSFNVSLVTYQVVRFSHVKVSVISRHKNHKSDQSERRTLFGYFGSWFWARDIKFGIQNGSDWSQMGPIWDFLRPLSVQFGSP